jgi:predicted DNA-binding protein with PD1-like motif
VNELASYSASGAFGKVVAYRLLPGTDFLTGIRQVCLEHGIQHGLIVSATGSLQRATFMVAATNPKARIGSSYSAPNIKQGPIEILTMQGIVLSYEGKIDFHVHGSFCDENTVVFGGHVVEGENPALTTIEGVVAQITGVQLGRKYDEQCDAKMFHPMQQ